MTDHIVRRASPHWPTFDLAETRPFLRGIGLEEDLIERFVLVWDAAFTIDYRTFRHRMKLLASATAEATGARLTTHPGLPDVDEGDRVVFLDDDDWLAPDLFARMPEVAEAEAEGYRWGSVRIGLDYDPTARGAAAVDLRPLSPIVYTNNYAVTGRMIGRLGWASVFEHTAADPVFRQAKSRIVDSPDYLSCAVKHPCCTTAVLRLMADAEFLADPTAKITGFRERLDAAELPDAAGWLAAPLAELRCLFRELAPR